MIIINLGFHGIHAEEGCLGCHHERKGFSAFHDPRQLGCSTCHLGDPEASEENQAHGGLRLFPEGWPVWIEPADAADVMRHRFSGFALQ